MKRDVGLFSRQIEREGQRVRYLREDVVERIERHETIKMRALEEVQGAFEKLRE